MSKMCYPEEIIGSKFENNTCYYLVKWKRCKLPTWEPDHHISHRTDLIGEYRDMLLIENMSMQNGALIYCRVSSKEQSKYNKGHTSLEVQEKEMREYCVENDINVLKVVKEVYSARNMDKMKGLSHLCEIASPYQTIMVYDISRFSRNAYHALNILEELKDKKVSVYSVTENISYDKPSGRNQFRLQLSASTYYSDMCSQKIKASVVFRRNRGDYIGRTHFGYTTEVDSKTNIRSKIVCPEEKSIIELIMSYDNRDPEHILVELTKKNIMFRDKFPSISGIKRIIKKYYSERSNSSRNRKSAKKTFYTTRSKPY
jgi:DNA invertase Pin-like site-specific DNA recombinase